jgi:hypothetical protein
MGVSKAKFNRGDTVYCDEQGLPAQASVVSSEVKKCKGDWFSHRYYTCAYFSKGGRSIVVENVRESSLRRREITDRLLPA